MTQVHYRILVPGKGPDDIYILKCGEEIIQCRNEELSKDLANPEVICNVTVDGVVCSLYFNALENANIRKKMLNLLWKTTRKKRILINITVSEPDKHFIDKKGNEMFEQSALEKRELDHALAWFSTFGGAFSALGDSMTNCAVIAGKISKEQFKLALRLADPNLQSRCRLYMALSLIQQQKFRWAKKIIQNEYSFATSQIVRDARLVSMCLGIWAKYKYDRLRAKTIKNTNSRVISL